MASNQLTVQNLQIHESLVGKRPPSGAKGGSKGISSIAGFKLSSSVAPTIAPSGRPASSRLGAQQADGGMSVTGSCTAMSVSRSVLSSRAANVLATLENELQEEQRRRTQLEARLSKLSQLVESMSGK